MLAYALVVAGALILARMLAPHIEPLPGAVVLRSDAKRKAIFGVAETATLSIHAYTTEVTDYIYATLVGEVRRPAAAGRVRAPRRTSTSNSRSRGRAGC